MDYTHNNSGSCRHTDPVSTSDSDGDGLADISKMVSRHQLNTPAE